MCRVLPALRAAIDATPWVDTHEHLVDERHRLGAEPYRFHEGPSGAATTVPAGWTALLDYARRDLVSAGLSPAARERLEDPERSPLEQWDAAAPQLEAARATGYFRAVELSTERLLGLRFAREHVEQIDARLRTLRTPGHYARVLREVANVARCHVHTMDADPFCETELPALLQQDLSLVPLVYGRHDAAERASGVEVGELDDYVRVIEHCFERYAARAVAVKCLWAYHRPFALGPDGEPPQRAFRRVRAGTADAGERRSVEDFLLRCCLALATEAGLPVKLHLGYLDGNGNAQLRHVFDHVRDVTPLVQAHPRTTFVLMHAAWPQQEQLLALAKHQRNVVVDLCWAWILAPLATVDFVQRFLTTAPANKLLCFGGDFTAVECVVGHAELARRGLRAALEGLVAQEWLTQEHALALVPRLMHGNADAIFPPRLADGSCAEPVVA
jgi:predicted TIM-barrel fold metal-dependent hydrolase